ncbi:hypothetical protein RIF29_40267 [Crotalaria pallida]|uniref:DUF4378 domain-containing protein n=1 Tax=Crotalaria pallida TaxID=3830 RepID=A0AAN9E3K8_CROPI
MKRRMVTEQHNNNNNNLEFEIKKQMGCMAGFLHIFDRHHILSGKRLPPPEPPHNHVITSSPENSSPPPPPPPSKSPLHLPVLELKEGSRTPWKFSPRLSLDSRAVVDSKGTLINRSDDPKIASEEKQQRRSTSVVARLMGLDDQPNIPDSEAELTRSASESRATRNQPRHHHRYQYRFFDTNNNFQLKQNPNNVSVSAVDHHDHHRLSSSNGSHPKTKTEPPFRVQKKKKKCFYDSGDFFPEQSNKNNRSVYDYGEIERRLRIRGIDEPCKDLHALKQILEALQLKGLLHHSNHSNNYKSTLSVNQSPIVLMKPNKMGRNVGHYSPQPSSFGSGRKHYRAGSKDERDVKARSQGRGRNLSSPTRNERCVAPTRTTNAKVAPVHSINVNLRRNVPEQPMISRSPSSRRRSYHKEEEEEEKTVLRSVAEDESSTVSDTSFTTSSHTNLERFKMEEYKEGRSLLERCDKLLNSIAEMTAATTDLQPSPVSVLDSSFYKDESSCSPSPVMKRFIDYKGDAEDEMWNAALCFTEAKYEDSDDFLYVSEIVRACNYFPEDNNVFMLLEKQQFLKRNDTSKTSTLRRRLIFDTIQEILNENQRLPPWNPVSWTGNKLNKIWSEFRRIREREEEESSEDLFDVICGLLRKDMAGDVMNECPVEMGGVVLDIERLVFKDLIVEIIQDLVSFNLCDRVSMFRRKLMF